MNNLALLGIGIMLMWLIALGFYFYTSRQQKEISKEMDGVRDLLDESDDNPEQAAL